jgi:peptide methionine sulfoxide reductase MsrB
MFSCAGCALHLYSTDTKFDSGTGWAEFYGRPWTTPQAGETAAGRSHLSFAE